MHASHLCRISPCTLEAARTATLVTIAAILGFAFANPCATAESKQITTESYVVYPETVHFSVLQPEQHVRIRSVDGSGVAGRSTALTSLVDLSITVLDTQVAEFVAMDADQMTLRGKSKGTTRLRIEWSEGGRQQTAEATLHCDAMDQGPEWEFTNHIQPILARNGCNMGACHGALAGKGGFRLSLRGYDPEMDHFNITRQDRGRRLEREVPELSLLLAKPSGSVEHKGGVRLPKESRDYQILKSWIEQGAAGPTERSPHVSRLEILPANLQLLVGDTDQLSVRVHYSNGRTEDVTHWAKFHSSDESVALVDEHGKIQVVGPGEGTVVAWFSSQIVSARIRVPFAHESSENASLSSIRSALGRANAIDDYVAEQLVALGIAPSQRCTDSEFLRRTSLDATGTLPTEDQIRNFLNDPSPDKRARWIDTLLASPEYTDYWAYRWSDVLMLNSNLLRTDGVKAYYRWIRSQVEQNTPWDQMVREILLARGEALENGATNFYAINQDPEGMTENACQAFLGLSIGCAKCHNHPLEKWTNDQYYAMANMFARVRAKGWGGEVRDGDAARTVYVVDQGDLIQPSRGRPQPPAPLDADPIDMRSPEDRRIVLAQWMTSAENPYFTRAIVNRVWAAYLGIGIVQPVDDLRASNPASNPALMDYLCRSLVEKKYDLKELMREIMNSETYQRSSVPVPGNVADKKYFSRYYPRRLMAEVIHDAIVAATGVPTEFNKVSFLGGDLRDTKFYPPGTKAIQLYDSSVESGFLKTFGRNQRRITCECERSDEPSVIQVLSLSNGDTVNDKLKASTGNVDAWLQKYAENLEGLIEAAFLRTLSRFPTEAERKSLVKELRSPETDLRIAVEDLLWSLMSSKEFLFNH